MSAAYRRTHARARAAAPTRAAGWAAAMGLACALAGCAAAPPDRFYTLDLPAGERPRAIAGALPAPEAGRTTAGIAAVQVPEIVDRAQLVVEAQPQQVYVLEGHRWAQPLPATIAEALATDLESALSGWRILSYGPLPTSGADAPALRIRLSFDRFDSRLSDAAGARSSAESVEAVHWSVSCAGGPAAARSGDELLRAEAPAGPDAYAGLVSAHARNIAQLAQRLADALLELRPLCSPAADAGRAPGNLRASSGTPAAGTGTSR